MKDNQPRLEADIDPAFETPEGLSPRQRRLLVCDHQSARSPDKGHGRREVRLLVSTTVLAGYADWPGLAQVFRLVRIQR